MKKLLILLTTVLCFALTTKAQYVTIPDANFRAFLQSKYPTAFNGIGQMNTTSTVITTEDSIDCSYQSIGSIDGIQYFTSLKVLDCSNNYLSSNQIFPGTLKVLNCSYNYPLSKLTLPSNLEYLLCIENASLDSLTNLPNSLKVLRNINYIDHCDTNYAGYSSLKYISNFSPNLQDLCLGFSSNLTNLPAIPSSLKRLVLFDLSNLVSLPTIPNGVEEINFKKLYKLTNYNIPGSVRILALSQNNLTSIPLSKIADYNNLNELYLCNNNISSIASLPDSLRLLWCDNNKSLQCLPKLPSKIADLWCGDSTKITCLPNKPSSLIYLAPSTLQVCNSTNNPNNCPTYNYVNIPDTNFAKFLIAKYPSCLYKDASNKYWMDTTCGAVVNEDTLDCSGKNIESLDGIQYFKNLIRLNCSSNGIATSYKISNLSNTIKSLDCYNTTFNLINIPTQIEYLNLADNPNLDSLKSLPNTLKDLLLGFSGGDCIPSSGWISNGIKYIGNFPRKMNQLNIVKCPNLTSIPVLPDTVVNLELSYLNITSLSSTIMPKYVQGLMIKYMPQLTNYTIPASVTGLSLEGNNLSAIPYSKFANFNSLTNFVLCNNNIATINSLPDSIKWLTLSNNNNLKCLPNLPSKLNELYVDNTSITCLPNKPSGLITSLPVCNPTNNPNNCPTYNYVNIPDSNFGKFLITQYPSCLYKDASNKYWMDTTCGAVVNEDSLDCSQNNIQDITGLTFFKNLKYFNCSQNRISILPALPQSLLELNIWINQITSLPPLPNSLRDLTCASNPITVLPKLPDSLRGLNCSFMLITSLPALPNSLTYLYCGVNDLGTLPTLPSNLLYLFCQICNLSSLPNLPNNLELLHCTYNKLSSLPNLPATLKTLQCGDNKDLNCLPILPTGLNSLDTDTSVHCLPNIPAGITTTLPVCNSTNNPNNCPTFGSSLPNYVNIPDTNFGKFLIAKYASCLYKDASNKYWMDTTCGAVVNEDSLQCGALNINSVEGLQYFKNLTYLVCRKNNLISLPSVSNKLIYIQCEDNQITILPSLPNSLVYLSCSLNKLTSLPTLPNKLDFLSCSKNQLTALPSLPNSLTKLNCNFNQITNLPNLPDSLTNLDCSSNQLSSLPALPSGLIYLFCSVNQLTYLPNLTDSLQYLWCAHNQLTSLPSLSNKLSSLQCNSNNIFCLPKLPSRLQELILDISKIMCLPNIPVGISATNTLPICNPTNNSNQCHIYPSVSSKVFTDINSNGTKNTLEFYRPFVKCSLNNGQYTYSNLKGEFGISLDSFGSYTLTVTPPPYYKAVPDTVNVTFTQGSPSIILPDIALQPEIAKDSFAIKITSLNSPRPGFKMAYNLTYGNVGTVSSTTSNVVQVLYDTGKIHFDSASLPVQSIYYPTTNMGLLNFDAGSLVAGQSGSFNLYYTVKTSATLGDSIKTSAAITFSSTKVGNTDSAIIIGSYDPNDKNATPTLTPQQVQNGEYIDYTIRFQNTGTASAINIVIADTLSSLLQYSNIQVVATSHNSNISYRLGNGIIYFEFLNINLPASSTNEPLSHGFVNFRVKALPTLASGATIPNTASIYFDYNSPIITNTATTQIKAVVTPVRIINYNVTLNEKQETRNAWTVGVEVNVSHYVVQRSENGRDFTSVGEVAAQGLNNYSFIDKLPIDLQQPVIYYRLKIIDKDGKVSYSEIKKISTINNQLATINMYPNPSKGNVTIETTGAKELLIIDYLGKTIKQLNITTEQQTINTKQFTKGVYMVKLVMNNGNVKTSKLIIE